MTPAAWLAGLLDLLGSQPVGRAYRQCPAHDDGSPSLSVHEGDDGRALLHCHAGCSTEEVLDALGLSAWHLFHVSPLDPQTHAGVAALDVEFPPLVHKGGGGRGGGWSGAHYWLEAVHAYAHRDDPRDERRYAVERWRHPTTGAKDLRWATRDSAGALIPGLRGATTSDLALYQESQVRMAVPARELVVVCESESSVDALTRIGQYATTWAGGASSPNVDRLVAVLAGGRVLLVPDNDEPGLECGRRIHRALSCVADVGYRLPDEGLDAGDMLGRHGLSWFRAETAAPVRQTQEPMAAGDPALWSPAGIVTHVDCAASFLDEVGHGQ